MEAVSHEARGEIERRLATIAEEEGIRFLLAIESGSRAWGFPSPDSDYDVRFIYARPQADYLTLRPVRDVVERPIIDDYDVNGWDIRKTLDLLLKHNAVVAEWLNSSIRYVPDDPVVARMSDLADRFFDPRGYALHYASLGTTNADRWLRNVDTIPAKRYFYSLRPALSIRALRLDPGARPPMRLQDLAMRTDLPAPLSAEIDHLVELKSSQREVGEIKRSPTIEALIDDELGRAGEVLSRPSGPEFLVEADALFRDIVGAEQPLAE